MNDKGKKDEPREIRVTDKRMFNAAGELREEFKELASALPPDPAKKVVPEFHDEMPSPKKLEEPPPAKQRPRRGSKEGPGSATGPDFLTVLAPFSTSAYMSLGIIPSPSTGLTEINLGAAREMIEILGLIKEKTAGNLAPDESRTLEQVLYELRMIYVEKTRKP